MQTELEGTLVIAKLDRLARNVHFVSGLMESGISFTACDNPHANRLTIHILAAVAEDEARRISERTKAALAAYKARGGLLGANRPDCPGLTPEARRKGQRAAGEASKRLADEAYADLIDDMRMWHVEGVKLLRDCQAFKRARRAHTARKALEPCASETRFATN